MTTAGSDVARRATRRDSERPDRGASIVTRPILPFIVFAGFLPLLAYVPRLVPLAPDVASAASVEGYNPSIAWIAAVSWIVVSTLAVAILATGSDLERAGGTDGRADDAASKPGGLPPILLLVGVAALVFFVYFPPFLARSGPFIEDQIHLGAIHRLIGGQQPYRDFEFLYGPLMLYVPWGWTKIFGYNLVSFYTFVALLEALSFVALTTITWMFVKDRSRRIFVLLVIAALSFNALVGPNWSVSRRLPALLALVVLASNPLAIRSVLATAALLAIQAAWSHDFGAAGMIGALGILALAARHGSIGGAIRSAVVLVAATAGLWAGLVWSLLGAGFGDYLREVRFLTSRFSAGEAGFEFYWTVNSLAVFLLLAFVCVIVGRRLLARRSTVPGPADYLLIGACGFLLITLKSGLNRSDMWHLDAPLLPLIFALLAPAARRIFTATRFEQRAIAGTIGVIAFTYAFGLLPSASFLAQGWWNGLTAGPAPAYAVTVPNTAAPALDLERRSPETPARRLAAFFGDPQRIHRPVVFYSDAWPLGKFIGVYKTDFVNDDFLYGDSRGEWIRSYLESNPAAMVVMTEPVYDRLFGLADSTVFPEHEQRFQPTPAKRIADWLSTVHYRGLDAEIAVKDARWRRTVGAWIRERFHVVAHIDSFIVLERDGS